MMKMRRIVSWCLMFSILLISASGLFGQTVVKDLDNVKKPALGKIYFSKKDSSLSLWKGKWVSLDFGQTQKPVVVPPVVTPPIISPVFDEIEVGYWAAPERILVAKVLNGEYHLMQTNTARSYYVPRGKNLLFNAETKVISQVLTPSLLQSIGSANSGLGGLQPPATFKDSFMADKGFAKNKDGEWVFGYVQPPVVAPVVDEVELGYWAAPERILVAKVLNGEYHLMQTNTARSYYVPRGKNLLFNAETKVISQVLTPSLLQSIASANSGLGGLQPPATFKDSFMAEKGFAKNKDGEWVFGYVQPPVVAPVVDEIELGYWAAPERILVAKVLNGEYHLMQTNTARSYYVPRGKNLLFNKYTKVNNEVLTPSLLQSIASGDSGLDGLQPPATFKDSFMTEKGFAKNKDGEWIFGQVEAPVFPQGSVPKK